jgi:hypothetical protein
MRDYLQAQTGSLVGVFPHQDYQVLGTYVSMLESVRRFSAAEAYLAGRMAKPEHEVQRTWLEDRMTELYNAALDAGSEVSLGKGNDLLRALFARGQHLLAAAKDDNVRHAAATRIIRTLEIGHGKKLPATAELVRTYAFSTLPATLKQQYSHYSNMVRGPLTVVTDVLGVTEACDTSSSVWSNTRSDWMLPGSRDGMSSVTTWLGCAWLRRVTRKGASRSNREFWRWPPSNCGAICFLAMPIAKRCITARTRTTRNISGLQRPMTLPEWPSRPMPSEKLLAAGFVRLPNTCVGASSVGRGRLK